LVLSRSPWARRNAVRGGTTGSVNGIARQPAGCQLVGAGIGSVRGVISSAGVASAGAAKRRRSRGRRIGDSYTRRGTFCLVAGGQSLVRNGQV
jgi:hypothetical protein